MNIFICICVSTVWDIFRLNFNVYFLYNEIGCFFCPFSYHITEHTERASDILLYKIGHPLELGSFCYPWGESLRNEHSAWILAWEGEQKGSRNREEQRGLKESFWAPLCLQTHFLPLAWKPRYMAWFSSVTDPDCRGQCTSCHARLGTFAVGHTGPQALMLDVKWIHSKKNFILAFWIHMKCPEDLYGSPATDALTLS